MSRHGERHVDPAVVVVGRYFHYATDAPIGPGYAIFSAIYAVRTAH